MEHNLNDSKSKPKKSKKVISQEHVDKRKQEKSIKYLLKESLQFSNYFKEKLQGHLNSNESKYNEDSFSASPTGHLGISQKLKFFEGGTLKPYQVEGVTWMTILFENGVSGILADEMGLGKTIQVIALICHLYEMHIDGPYLIIVPVSTLMNWMLEFKRFAPKIPVIKFYGNEEERFRLQQSLKKSYNLNGKMVKPVIVTTYGTPMLTNMLRQNVYQYMIVDEGHRLKNHESKLRRELLNFRTSNKLLLTGTPIQNNLNELWSLLNFIVPHIFKDMESFSSFVLMEDLEDNKIESTDLISKLHQVLAPFMLRRLKSDVLSDMVPKKEVLVYCPMSDLQLKLYKYTLEKNIKQLKNPLEILEDETDLVNTKRRRTCENYADLFKTYEDCSFDPEEYVGASSNAVEAEVPVAPFISRLTMQNPMMMCRKIVDHPYLVHFPLDPNSTIKELLVDENLVKSSGKMLVLEAMLSKLHEGNHKVLIFSTLVMTLHLIEEFLIMRNYQYRSITGSMKVESRQASINEFNNDPNIVVFLCSTRSGGLGINLTAADTVIFFDRDWNPQADLQAQDRCHRIGQTKPVLVFTLITKNTIDDRVIQCATQKRKLEKIVIKDGKFKNVISKKTSVDLDLEELQKILESSETAHKIQSNGFVFTDEELNVLLDRTELYDQMIKK
ncbi:hypothetical protein FQR65_LT07217 [Abscondita terminalis]|nr:hypothetical protein FQR65_LT07217 [Abscondita terminalis]